jgi:translation initiation factor eIF-2B subunit beta
MYFRELMAIVKQEGRRMMNAQPSETAVGNMVRRGLLAVDNNFETVS